MRRLIGIIGITAALLAFHSAAYAACTTQGILAGGQYTVCTTCCPSPGNCFTVCS